ncbi:hypothetical protein SDC9_14860 [bioreactor metagenome]|jgi:long-subunit fatty acid transport protein|uniref:Uncharacterized protein n=1 Tax=bioreactor metagenome TaxID=1076179 RepID=A0A644TQ47_9ZZZZ|nr:hypothetical protein [Lentimicrobium sp.]MEA5108898.1 hypothetical protein [Lentimicrobium sp.]
MKQLRLLVALIFIPASSLLSQTFSSRAFSPFSPGAGLPLWTTQTMPAFSLQTGAEFGMFNNGSMLNTYLAPVFSQPLGKRLTLSAGAMISNTTFNNAWIFDPAGELSGFSGNITTTTLFGSGSYQVNERLTVTGAAYKTINPAFNSRLSPDKLQMEAQGVSMGVGYRINDNLHIGAEIRMQQGNSNFYAPFANPASPFRNSIYGF